MTMHTGSMIGWALVGFHVLVRHRRRSVVVFNLPLLSPFFLAIRPLMK